MKRKIWYKVIWRLVEQENLATVNSDKRRFRSYLLPGLVRRFRPR
jgi:hypothetical protein